MITWFKQWQRRRLVAKAMPTLCALCRNVPDGYHREVNHLWLDGGNRKGAMACYKLGWAAFSHQDRIVGATTAGRTHWRQSNAVRA